MQFSVRHVKEDGLAQVILREEASATEVAVLPDYGASLHAFRIPGREGAIFNVIDNYADRAELEKEMAWSFKSPKLSPFPCRIAGGKYLFEGQKYQFSHLFAGGTAIHGLLYNKAFTIIEETADDAGAMLCLEYQYKKEEAGYPFDYSCTVRYLLHPGGLLEVSTTVTNFDTGTIPIADGWHPYFQLGGKIDGWSLQFHASAIVDFDDQLIPTGTLTQYDEFDIARPIGDRMLDNCWALKPGLVGPACELFNPENGLRVSFFPDEKYPYLQVYTPPERESVAVENLSGAPDCFNNKMGLTLLAPGHSQIFTVRYKVSIG